MNPNLMYPPPMVPPLMFPPGMNPASVLVPPSVFGPPPSVLGPPPFPFGMNAPPMLPYPMQFPMIAPNNGASFSNPLASAIAAGLQLPQMGSYQSLTSPAMPAPFSLSYPTPYGLPSLQTINPSNNPGMVHTMIPPMTPGMMPPMMSSMSSVSSASLSIPPPSMMPNFGSYPQTMMQQTYGTNAGALHSQSFPNPVPFIPPPMLQSAAPPVTSTPFIPTLSSVSLTNGLTGQSQISSSFGLPSLSGLSNSYPPSLSSTAVSSTNLLNTNSLTTSQSLTANSTLNSALSTNSNIIPPTAPIASTNQNTVTNTNKT